MRNPNTIKEPEEIPKFADPVKKDLYVTGGLDLLYSNKLDEQFDELQNNLRQIDTFTHEDGKEIEEGCRVIDNIR